jgi:hypothetical protein
VNLGWKDTLMKLKLWADSHLDKVEKFLLVDTLQAQSKIFIMVIGKTE